MTEKKVEGREKIREIIISLVCDYDSIIPNLQQNKICFGKCPKGGWCKEAISTALAEIKKVILRKRTYCTREHISDTQLNEYERRNKVIEEIANLFSPKEMMK